MSEKDNAVPSGSSKPTIEKIYQKKTQLEHILLRPDTYIGSVEQTTELMWIYNNDTEKMVQKEISFVPGLYKIFDEILVNAADHKQRDSKMDTVKVEISQETNTISIYNNGEGIPVVMHKEENMYVPTMIFGHLLTSSNYNDEEKKVTGGRNGYGAKLCNIFSKKFIVETSSKKYKKSFKQTWSENMTKTSEAKIREYPGDEYTLITFSPDLTKFKMQSLDDDIVALMTRRVYDIAASSKGVKVFLNNRRLPVKSFKDYIDLYIKGREDETGSPLKVVHEVANPRWEVAITISDKGYQHVSFVNSIATTKGGRHVDHVTDSVVKQLSEVLKKKNKGGIQIKPFQIKNHLWVFVNCLIENPTFDSQTKETMTLQPKNFGSKCTLTDKFITAVSKSGIVESVLSWAKFKAQNDLAKHSGKKQSKLKGIPKLEDANEAGTKNAYKCTLILTEGDSAKSLVVSGFAVIGRDHYGVFPLRGKLLNVREATHKQILENAEINHIIKILGLQYKKKYNTADDLKSLRYGKLMIMTDQDQDGSHIKGLLINFIHHNWPELLRLNFLQEFITPIVKATKKNQELSFYSLPEFTEWKSTTPNHHTYNIKYYKGLGTSTSKEAKEYFQNMQRHLIKFKYDGQIDDTNILMAFSKKCVEQRKDWLTNHMEEDKRRKELGMPERYLYNKDTKQISYSEFINLELILFSNADNVRSIPSMVDGLKPGQRKVLFTCIKRNDKKEIKVAQLAGSVAEHSAYHHGETSLCMTIINLAQNYVGSNNINLLMPNGQFGTRLIGGKDAASPRYIFTMMSPLTRLIFHQHDDPLLKHEFDDNLKIEPVWYMPIIPMALVNGADGIGTGWMTKIPNYNPRDLVSNLRRLLNGEEIKPLIPWYKNFKGTIEGYGDRFVISGEISILGHDKIEITELPVGTWTQNYKENVLEPMLHGTEKVKAVITDYKEYNTDTTVRIVVTVPPNTLADMEREGLHKVFKLQTTFSMTSMVLFDEAGCLKRYNSANEILMEFYGLRIKYYSKRKDFLEGMLSAEAKKISNQARFILEKCSGQLVIENKKRKEMVQELIRSGYDEDPVQVWKKNQLEDNDDNGDGGADTQEDPEEEEQEEVHDETKFKKLSDVKKFDYLLGMAMWVLTKERKEELIKQKNRKLQELKILQGKTPSDLWREDLDEFSAKLDVVEEKERKDERDTTKKLAKGAKPVKGKKTNLDESLPTDGARRVNPTISEELVKKMNSAANAKQRKAIKAEMNIKEEEKDEFDLLVENNKKDLKSKLGTSPEMIDKKIKARKDAKKDKMKQTKLSFKKVNGNTRKRKSYSGSGSTSGSETSDVEIIPPKIEKDKPSRAAAAKIKYSFDSDSDIADKEINNVQNDRVPMFTDSEDDDFNKPKKVVAQENLADSLFDALISKDKESKSDFSSPEKVEPVVSRPVEIKDSSDEFDNLVKENQVSLLSKLKTKKKEVGEKRKRAQPTKTKPISLDSDDESDATPAPKKPAPKRKLHKPRMSDSEDDFKKPAKKQTKKQKSKESSDDDDDDDVIENSPDIASAPKPSARARKPIKYNFDDSDEDF